MRGALLQLGCLITGGAGTLGESTRQVGGAVPVHLDVGRLEAAVQRSPLVTIVEGAAKPLHHLQLVGEATVLLQPVFESHSPSLDSFGPDGTSGPMGERLTVGFAEVKRRARQRVRGSRSGA